MRLSFKAVSAAPDYYEISGDTVTAYIDDQAEQYDLSPLPEGARLTGVSPVGGATPISTATRIDGELHVTLLQRVIAGQYPGRKARWRGQATIDARDYSPDTCYVVPTGMAGVDDYEIVRGVDVAGNTGWTVRKKETADG
ncbi:hypothetical protein NFG57_11360 [Halomonas sp. H10-59]|uniref:Uncharacterized protein n=1 Tax=Halomonas sp. H10-59 TaxID=2950874 RepID=A0AAU7KR06_9GAMM